jgi:hypothetical protein
MIMRLRIIFIGLALMMLLIAPVFALDTPMVSTYRQVYVFAGPGHTHTQIGVIDSDIPLRIVERNRVGNWVRIQRMASDGSVILDGWIISGYIRYTPELRYSLIPVNYTEPDHNPGNAAYASFAELYRAPLVSPIDELMVEVFEMGQDMGNNPNGVTKVGDSLLVSPQILNVMSRTDNALGPYDFLAPTIAFYGQGITPYSVANTVGMSTFTVLDPMWAPGGSCLPNEAPLTCEYRIRKPSVAFILFGPNDLRASDAVTFGRNIARIVDETLAAGIIPVLSTFSLDQESDLFWSGINFNLELKRVAEERHVPLINLWGAARPLPAYGLDQDRVHLLLTGWDNLRLDGGQEAFSGAALYNLLAIYTLDSIRAAVGLGA